MFVPSCWCGAHAKMRVASRASETEIIQNQDPKANLLLHVFIYLSREHHFKGRTGLVR
ncbi:hypothetical protein SBDP2_1880004 [Syntrophobacter sp. SbD2]|nr:hypothetical protein SBDP2_1880004 [Syntrophobacter sp. SbD2]